MNGELAQIVALTLHAKAVLQGREINAFQANSTCKFCESIRFVDMRRGSLGGSDEQIVAASPGAWFEFLKTRKAQAISLSRFSRNRAGVPDRMASAFSNGGEAWIMQVSYAAGEMEAWMPGWSLGNKNAPDRRIWRVTYLRESTPWVSEQVPIDISGAVGKLETSLREIRAFSERQQLELVAPDLAPDAFFAPGAKRLLDACQKSWVFGGMGSWNDMGFDGEDEKEYERVSEQLFQSINSGIVTAVNAPENGKNL